MHSEKHLHLYITLSLHTQRTGENSQKNNIGHNLCLHDSHCKDNIR